MALDRLHVLQDELREAQAAACPIKVGDIVRWDDRSLRKGTISIETLLTKVDSGWSPENPHMEGRRRTKAGWSKAITHVYGRKVEVIGHEEPTNA